MTNKQITYTIVIAAILVVAYFGFRPNGWFRSSTPVQHKQGHPCMTKNTGTTPLPGKYDANGNCIPTPGGPNGGPDATFRPTSHTPYNPIAGRG